MLGRDAQGLAQAKGIGLHGPRLSGAALGLVGGDDDVLGAAAQDLGEILVGRGDADARVDDEQADVGLVNGAFGQAAHASLKAVILGHLQARAVDDDKAQVAKAARALADVAGHAGLVIDQRKFLANQTVEQGGLAHIGPPDDRKGECHLNACNWPLRATT